MRNLTNPDDLAQVMLDIDEPLRGIIRDSDLKETFKNGTYWDLIMHMLRCHKTALYAVVAALDGTIAAEEVPARYTVTQIIALIKDAAKTEGVREIVSFFVPATRKSGAGSSGESPASIAE